MYTLSFANTFGRRNFPPYTREHGDLDSVALEILRVREELEPEQSLAAYDAVVHDANGKEVVRLPTATRDRVVCERLSAEKHHASGATTRTVQAHDVFDVTKIDGREVSRKWVRSE